MRKDYNYNKKIIIYAICFVIILIALVLQNRTFRIIFLSVGAAIIIVGTILFIRHVVNIKRAKKNEEIQQREWGEEQERQRTEQERQRTEQARREIEEQRRREDEIRNAFYEYVKGADKVYHDLKSNERVNKIIDNFFKSNRDCEFFFFLDEIRPSSFINGSIRDGFFKIENYAEIAEESSVAESIIYQFIQKHGEIGANPQTIIFILDDYYKSIKEPSILSLKSYKKKVENIYAATETLLISLITTGLVQDSDCAKTACLVYFNMMQAKRVTGYFSAKYLAPYNLTMPTNIYDLARIVLEKDSSVAVKRVLLYGSAIFYPTERKRWLLRQYAVDIKNLADKIKQEKFIHSLETMDVSAEKQITTTDLSLMSGLEFEEFIAKFFEKLGYHSRTTKKSGDQGVDVLAEKDGRIIAIQTKCYNQPVGNKAVQEIVAGMKFYHAQKGIVVTNSTFTPSAKELALANRIVLWDGDTLMSKYRMTEDNLFDEE